MRKPYSVQQSKLDAIENEVRRAKILVKTNPDYKIKYPGEARDANKKDYTVLETRIRKEIKDHQDKAEARRERKKNVKK